MCSFVHSYVHKCMRLGTRPRWSDCGVIHVRTQTHNETFDTYRVYGHACVYGIDL